ncbi:MAG: hypothetical protein WBV82_00795 [Myxococcaceae bacterium]
MGDIQLPQINNLPPSFHPLAQRIDADSRVGGKANDGQIHAAEVQKARELGVFSTSEMTQVAALEQALKALSGGPTPHVPVGTDYSPWDLQTPETAGAAHTQVIELGGAWLEPGKPVVLEGVARDRPIAFVQVDTASGAPVDVRVGRELQKDGASASAWGFDQPVLGEVSLLGYGSQVNRVTVHYAEASAQGNSDYYSIPIGKDGIKHGQAMELPIPPHRQGREIQNIDVSFHAPLRDFDKAKKWENKPTYCTWYTDDTHLMRKFVDPNADNGNSAEIDNIHPHNADDAGVLAKAGKTVRIVAENGKIPADENAMTVQWVRVTYKPQSAEIKSFNFKGAPLPNQEWEGKWVSAGQTLALDVDPNRKISRVEIQWSDKPDNVGYNEPGKWAEGSVLLDGKPVGKEHEHVGSPEWQFFDNLKGIQGQKLEIRAELCPIKVFEVKVHYEG